MPVSTCVRRTLSSNLWAGRAIAGALRLLLVGIFAGTAPVAAQDPSIAESQALHVPEALPHTTSQSMHIHRNANGAFIAQVLINGVSVRVIIDTGSQGNILSVQDARTTGADGDITSSETMAGNAGYTRLNLTRVKSMDIGGQQMGGFSATNRQAGIPYTLPNERQLP